MELVTAMVFYYDFIISQDIEKLLHVHIIVFLLAEIPYLIIESSACKEMAIDLLY